MFISSRNIHVVNILPSTRRLGVTNLLNRLELGSKLAEGLVGLSVRLEEGGLVSELVSVGGESRVLPEALIRSALEEFLVGGGVVDSCEVRVVENQPVRGPRGSSRGVRSGLTAVSELGGASIGELGLLRTNSTSVSVSSAEGVSSRKGDDALVIESHPVEDLPEVPRGGLVLGGRGSSGSTELALGSGLSIGEVSLRAALLGRGGINTSILHVDLGSAGKKDSAGAGHLEDISVRDSREGLLDGLEELDGSGESGVGAVVDLGIESDRSDGTTGGGPLLIGKGHIVGSRVVPREANEDGAAVLLL